MGPAVQSIIKERVKSRSTKVRDLEYETERPEIKKDVENRAPPPKRVKQLQMKKGAYHIYWFPKQLGGEGTKPPKSILLHRWGKGGGYSNKLPKEEKRELKKKCFLFLNSQKDP